MRAYNTNTFCKIIFLVFFLPSRKKINKLFTGFGSVRIVKNCDLSLENAALGLRPRAAFSRPRSQVFTIRTSQPANNIYLLRHNSYNKANFTKTIRHITHVHVLYLLTLFLISKSIRCLSFRVFLFWSRDALNITMT